MLYFARIIALAGNLINLHCCVALATPLNLVHPTVSDPLSIACLLADVRLFTRAWYNTSQQPLFVNILTAYRWYLTDESPFTVAPLHYGAGDCSCMTHIHITHN